MSKPNEIEKRHLYKVSGGDIYIPDKQDQETLEAIADTPKIHYYFEPDDLEDNYVVDRSGKVVRVRQFSINGIQFSYPVDQHVQIDMLVFNLIQQSKRDTKKVTVQPGVFRKIAEIPKRR